MIDREYKGGYRYPYGTRRMVEDKEATKDAAYAELEDMANEMIKFMDSSGIDIFEYSIHSPQRKKAWTIIADTRKGMEHYRESEKRYEEAKNNYRKVANEYNTKVSSDIYKWQDAIGPNMEPCCKVKEED